jgi:hypothetical protein
MVWNVHSDDPDGVLRQICPVPAMSWATADCAVRTENVNAVAAMIVRMVAPLAMDARPATQKIVRWFPEIKIVPVTTAGWLVRPMACTRCPSRKST